ncbi:MAG: DUF6713 family protein [Pseudomonadota bacterium]|jgi:hypothetical protein|nr:DUF6713 family protein [Pseudomonadota bacterium]
MHPLLFLLGLSFLLAHEIDAALNAEWRLLYVLRSLSDPTASAAFVWVHVPLFVGLLWLAFLARPGVQRATRAGLSSFLVIHAALHLRLSDHPLYGFAGWDSNGLILGAALAGALYLLCEAIALRRRLA